MAQNQTDQALSQDLIDTLPDTIKALDSSIENINEQIDFLTDDLVGVSAVMSIMTTGSDAWIDLKADTLSVNFEPSAFGGYGNNNLTQWHIYDSTVRPRTPLNPAYIQFDAGDVVSGAPSAAETEQYNRQIDFPVGLDHMNHELDLTGTYGIVAKIDSLDTSLELQTINRDAYQGFLKAYSRNI